MQTQPGGLWMEEEDLQAVLAHLHTCLPEEGCGLLGGRFMDGVARVEEVYPVENELHSPVRFRMRPVEQYRIMMEMEKRGLELAGIYHSHPGGPEHPSVTDLAEFFYPGVVVLIASPDPRGQWQVRGFSIENQAYSPVPLKIVSSTQPGPK